MINTLHTPKSIAVIGASDNQFKPGGALWQNLSDGRYRGELFGVNPSFCDGEDPGKKDSIAELPGIDLAFIAVKAALCLPSIQELHQEHGTRSFIIVSAGFSETDEAGAEIEDALRTYALEHQLAIVGPNCIGVLTENYSGLFTQPIPDYDRNGVELISASGATAVFIMEAGIKMGIPFSNVFSVGNSTVVGIEEVLEELDMQYASSSASIKLLYIEQINKPGKFLQHCLSLSKKGCQLIALKSGTTASGQKAAASHTGALSSPDQAVEALFRKAGIVRAHSKTDLLHLAAIAKHKQLKGNRMMVITHAGGPGVIISDELDKAGFLLPSLSEKLQHKLKMDLFDGASTINPIDILATGTPEQLQNCIHVTETSRQYDGIVVIIGSPGLGGESEMFKVIEQAVKKAAIPVYPVFPSPLNCRQELELFVNKKVPFFFDEVLLAKNLGSLYQPKTIEDRQVQKKNNELVTLAWSAMTRLTQTVALPIAPYHYVENPEQLNALPFPFPIVMKADTTEHRTGKMGIKLNLHGYDSAVKAYEEIKQHFPDNRIIVQPMIRGFELFVGIKNIENFGPLLFVGTGGIWIEVVKDMQFGLAPLDKGEIKEMVTNLACYPILSGYRNQVNVNIEDIYELLSKLSQLAIENPEIEEADFNPVILNSEGVHIVDQKLFLKKR